MTAGLIAGGSAQAAGEAALAPPGARTLHDLTERLAVIPRRREGIVLTPGAVATAIELQRVGFAYCR